MGSKEHPIFNESCSIHERAKFSGAFSEMFRKDRLNVNEHRETLEASLANLRAYMEVPEDIRHIWSGGDNYVWVTDEIAYLESVLNQPKLVKSSP